MKKIVLSVIGLFFLVGCVSAYQVYIDAPDTLQVGKPLIVNGTTTIGIGTPIDIVLYYQLTTTTEVDRKIVYVQADHTFRTSKGFDTTGLKPGMYKVEVPYSGGDGSVNMRLVQLIDRSDEIQLDSSMNQVFTGKLSVAGTIKTDANSGVQIDGIDSNNNVIFGPQYVNTNYLGGFSVDIPVTAPGEYQISFTDSQGFVGTRVFTAVAPPTLAGTAAVVTATRTVVSAHTQSTRESPAYFVVKTTSQPVLLYTSSSVDWVIEYIDDKNVLHVENAQGEANPEKAAFQGTGKPVYVKVYPYKYSVSAEVFLYAENATSVTVSQTVPAPFASSPTQTPTQATPLMPLLGLIAVGFATILGRR